MPDTDHLHYSDLHSRLFEAFPEALIYCRDRSYQPTTPGRVIAAMSERLRTAKRTGLGYSAKWDCDDFSTDAVNKIRKDFARTAGDAEADSLAVGLIDYVSDSVGRHMIVWFLDGENKIRFMEPQTLREVTLTDQEKQNVKYICV